jgi:methionyl-tRNA synthetase
MLKAHGGFVLPDNVPANEFLNIEGQKVSTSRNWAVWVDEFVKDFPGQQDMLRYVLCANAPESKDNDFTWKDFQDRINNELVSVFGNFVNRAFVLMHKLCGGRVPKLHEDVMDDADRALIAEIKGAAQKVEACLEGYKFRDGLFEVIDLARKANKYMQDKQPWIVAKTLDAKPEDQKLIDNCLHLCLQLTANLAILSNPFLPFTSKKMCSLMKVVERMLDWENAGRIDLLKSGYPLPAPELLFRKIEDAEVAAQVEKLHDNLKKATMTTDAANNNQEAKETAPAVPDAPAYLPPKPEITIDDFAKIDLRVATVLSAEKVEKADKLLKLELDLGYEKRTVLSGIAQHFKPEDIVGKQVTVVANLAPRKMKGIESKGMILMAQNLDGGLVFAAPVTPADNGGEVR